MIDQTEIWLRGELRTWFLSRYHLLAVEISCLFCLLACGQCGAQSAEQVLAQVPNPPQPAQLIPFSVPNTPMPAEQAPSQGGARLLTLQASLNQSLAQSPRMASVRALLGVSRAAYWQAFTLPNLGIYINNSYHNAYLLGATIPIEPPWKMVFRYLVAKRQLEQNKLDILKSMWLFRGEVRKNYAQLVMCEEMLTAREKLKNLAEKILQTTQTNFQNGNVPGLDVRRSKLAYIQAKMDCQQAEIKLSQAKEQMNLVMGLPADSPIKIPVLPDPRKIPTGSELLPDLKTALPTRDQFVKMAREHRLEIKLAHAAIRTNDANLKNAYGNIIPTPRFVFARAHELNPPDGPNEQVLNFQAYADVPTFDWQQGSIARFKAMDKQLKMDLRSQFNQVEGQVELAYKNLFAARERIRSFQDEALPEADGIATVSQHGYELGQTDLNTLLDSQRVNIQTKTQYLDAVLVYQLAINDLEQAIGVPLGN